MGRRRWPYGLPALCAGALLAGCGGAGERVSDVAASVAGFEHALRAGDAERACGLLAPETRSELEDSERMPCPEALPDQRLPTGAAARGYDVHGRQARAVLSGDTVFLSRFPGGWRVVAAGCTARSEQPYDCTVKGG